MRENISDARFQTLQFPGTPWSRWAWSLGINAGIVAGLVAIPVTISHTATPEPSVSLISLVAPAPYTPRPATRPVKPVRKSTVSLPLPKPRELKAPVLPPAQVASPAPVQITRVEAPKIDTPRPVANSVPLVSLDLPKPIKVGGFGNPNGARDAVASNRPSTVPTIGAFDAPAGGGTAKSVGGAGKLVASAGFGVVGNGSQAAPGGALRGSVRGAGFGDYDKAAAPGAVPQPVRPVAPAETPVEITYKPKPAYTPEAREKKIEGEVLLEVEFGANGRIHVLRLVHGLGYGLDENARAAASQIRFRPGTKNGTPVDLTGTLHIYFELS